MRPVRPLLLAALLPLALAACADAGTGPTGPTGPTGAVAAPSFAAATTFTGQDHVPLEGTIFDRCSGQEVTFTGKGHYLYHETIGSNGVTIKGHFNAANIKGVGEDGTRYVGSQADNNSFILHFANGGLTESSTFTFRATSLGRAPNLLVRAVFHVTLTPAGVPTGVVDTFSVECSD